MEKIKIIGLNCSPRIKSNSADVLIYSLNAVKKRHPDSMEFDIINLKDHHIQPCQACDVCGKTKDTGKFVDCVLSEKDDVKHILAKLIESDGIAMATPVYFGMPSDLFSKFIMRTRVLRHQDFALANKVVGIMAIAGRRSGGAETTILTSWLPFIRHGCLIVGNGDHTCQFGTMAWAGARGQIMSDEWGLEQSVQTVERIYDVARLVKAGISALKHKNPMTFCYKSGTR